MTARGGTVGKAAVFRGLGTLMPHRWAVSERGEVRGQGGGGLPLKGEEVLSFPLETRENREVPQGGTKAEGDQVKQKPGVSLRLFS